MCKLHFSNLRETPADTDHLGLISYGLGWIFLRSLGGCLVRGRALFHLPCLVTLTRFHGEGKLLDRSCPGESNPFSQVWVGSMPEEGSQRSGKAHGLWKEALCMGGMKAFFPE